MKKFIIKSNLFVWPFIFMYILNFLFYNQREGDLVRLGYLYSNPSPRSSIVSQYCLSKRFTLLSELDLKVNKHFDVITIGDSFSEQDCFGYKNLLGHKGLEVLHIDRYISGSNPIQTLINLLNSNIFDNVSADYVVLQNVERSLNFRTKEIDLNGMVCVDSILNPLIQKSAKVQEVDLEFFSDATIKIPITNFQFLFQSKPHFSKTYMYPSTFSNLFSGESKNLLFYQGEIENMKVKNDSQSIVWSAEVIELVSDKVSAQKMKLINLISPDKYDLYFDYIKHNKNLVEPLFFQTYSQLEKSYLNVESFKSLRDKIKSEKDIYFYDGTHWSPIGAKIIAEEIHEIILNDKS